MKIDELNWKMVDLIRKFNDNPFVTADLYEEFEFNLLEYGRALFNELHQNGYDKIQFDLEYTEQFEKTRPDCKSNADAEAKVDATLAIRKSKLKAMENTNQLYDRLYKSYCRRWEVMRSRLISNMSEAKQTQTAIQSISNELPF